MFFFGIVNRHVIFSNNLSETTDKTPFKFRSGVIDFGTTNLLDEDSRQQLENILRAEAKEIMEGATRLSEEIDAHNYQSLDSPRALRVVEPMLRLILEMKHREAVIAYLHERYERETQRRGAKQAEQWLYYEVARSVPHFLLQVARKISGRIVRARRAE